MFNKILIANRGEIAVRIIRACRNLGIRSVAVYSKEDAKSLHVQLADQRICIGEGPARNSYLNMDRIIAAAENMGADAIHPGFGFLSENSEFVRKCKENGITFIGPDADVIDKMGNKSHARKTMMDAGVPVVPGTKEPVYDAETGKKLAEEIGYPVMIKASSGGGGKGMRVAANEDEFEFQFNMAQRESANAFGDDTMYIERFVENPRHVEIQIMADSHGNVVALGERDCSVQRNHQKLIEEAPSAFLSDGQRQKMCACAVALAQRAGYTSAGTVEFLVDDQQNFYFCEMNTRIQVEHGISEEITGLDLVAWQLRIAAGEQLDFVQKDVPMLGHAIECRINAEDAEFRPRPGTIQSMHLAGGIGVRVDTAIYQGYHIPPFYDSMICKLMTFGRDRRQASARMKRALSEMLFEGIVTNTDRQLSVLLSDAFERADFNTNSMEDGVFDVSNDA